MKKLSKGEHRFSETQTERVVLWFLRGWTRIQKRLQDVQDKGIEALELREQSNFAQSLNAETNAPLQTLGEGLSSPNNTRKNMHPAKTPTKIQTYKHPIKNESSPVEGTFSIAALANLISSVPKCASTGIVQAFRVASLKALTSP